MRGDRRWVRLSIAECSDGLRRPLREDAVALRPDAVIRLASLYSHTYSHRVGTSRDETGRAGTTNSDNARKHSKLLTFAKADSHLENR